MWDVSRETFRMPRDALAGSFCDGRSIRCPGRAVPIPVFRPLATALPDPFLCLPRRLTLCVNASPVAVVRLWRRHPPRRPAIEPSGTHVETSKRTCANSICLPD